MADDARPLAVPWEGFWRTQERGTHHPDAQCKFCGKTIKSAQPKRDLAKHAERCKTFPTDLREKIVRYAERDHGMRQFVPRKRASDGTVLCACGKRLDRMDPDKMKRCQAALAEWIYMAGLPFRTVENVHLRKLIQAMCPEFVFPSRKQVATDMLESTYDELREGVVAELKQVPFVTIVTDGWASPNDEGIVNFGIATPMTKPVFWKSICIGGASVTADFVFDHITDVIEEVEDEIGRGKVVAVLSDICNPTFALHDMLEAEFPGLIAKGSPSHMLDMVFKDFQDMNFFDSAVSTAAGVLKVIKNRNGLINTFRHIQASKPDGNQHGLKLPAATRSSSSHTCLLGYTGNRTTIKELFQHGELVERYMNTPANKQKLQRTKNIIRDDAKWEAAQVACELMEPVSNAIATLEKDNIVSSNAYLLFKSLLHHKTYASPPKVTHIPSPKASKKSPSPVIVNIGSGKTIAKAKKRAHVVPQPERGPEIPIHEGIKTAIQDRWNLIHTSAMGIAFLLDHTRSTREFYDDDYVYARLDTLEYARRLQLVGDSEEDGKAFFSVLTDFETCKEGWSREEREIHCATPPFRWWLSQHRYLQLRTIALRIFSVCSSFATCERAWSMFNFIHSAQRNHLSKTVEMLVFIYTNLDRNLKERTDDIFYMMNPGHEWEEPDDSPLRTTAESAGPDVSEEHTLLSGFVRLQDQFGDSRRYHQSGPSQTASQCRMVEI